MAIREWIREQRPNIIWALLVLAWGGAVTAATYLTEGLGIWQKTGLSLIVMFTFGWAVIATYIAWKKRPTVTVDNVEARLKEWIPPFGYAYVWKHSDSSHFLLEVTLANTRRIAISRTKSLDKYLTIQTSLKLSDPDLEKYKALADTDKLTLRNTLIVALSNFKIGFNYRIPEENKLTLVMRLPILELSEHLLIKAIDEMECALLLGSVKFTTYLTGPTQQARTAVP